MNTGFSTEHGRVARVRERCVVKQQGHSAIYKGTVDVHITHGTPWTLWSYHEGMFDADTQILTPGNHDTQCLQQSGRAPTGITSLSLYSEPRLRPGEDVQFLQHVTMQHTDPLCVLRRTSGDHGLELLKLQIGFAADSLPTGIWQCEWERDGPQESNIRVLAEMPVALYPLKDDEFGTMKAVHLELEDVPPNRTFGFHWEW